MPAPKKNFLTKILETLVVFFSIGMITVMITLIASRFLGISLIGALEVVMLFAIWLYMLGSILASKNDTHLEVDLLALIFKNRRIGLYHKVYINFATLIITSFFTFLSYKMVAWGLKLPQTTPALSIPLTVPSSAILLAAIASTIISLRKLYTSIILIKSPASGEQ